MRGRVSLELRGSYRGAAASPYYTAAGRWAVDSGGAWRLLGVADTEVGAQPGEATHREGERCTEERETGRDKR